MPTNKDLVALDAEAVRASVDMVARATAGDLAGPTPCAGWTLRDLLGHMTAQHHGFAAASRGEGDIAVWRPRPLGDDPVGAYREAAQHVLEAFAVDGVTERAFPSRRSVTADPSRAHRPSASTSSTTSCTPGTWRGRWATR